MTESEKSEFEKELRALMEKHEVQTYFDYDDKKWYFIDRANWKNWDGKVYFPIETLPQADNR